MTTIPVKSGTLFKKGSGAGLLFRRYNWTPRHCLLTTTALNYYTHQGGALKGSIDLTKCTVHSFDAMPQDCPKTGRSVATGWRIAIQTPSKRYFVAASSERDMHEWLHALKEVVQVNEKRRTDYPRIALKLPPMNPRPTPGAIVRRWFSNI